MNENHFFLFYPEINCLGLRDQLFFSNVIIIKHYRILINYLDLIYVD